VYTITDVKELAEWMYKHFKEHPLFEEVPSSEVVSKKTNLNFSPSPLFIHSFIHSFILSLSLSLSLSLILSPF
jgi:hypothetical protein